jgi:hypothetical protein
MRILTLVLGTLLLQVPAKADKFWLSDPKAEKAAEGAPPNILTGVLIAESDEGYHVRVVGGEVILPKASVFKIEKDGLSVDDIVKTEKDQAEALAAADRERQMAQAAARREREVRAVEAAVRRDERRAAAEAAASAATEIPVEPISTTEPSFDPVVDALRMTVQDPMTAMMRDLKTAWNETRDRDYLKMLRRMRRLR